jgi:protein-tyrosine phosphatase
VPEVLQELHGAWNFRDVASTAAVVVRPGSLFRSSELSRLDGAGRDRFAELGITDVADLRSAREVTRNGADSVSDDVVVHPLPFRDTDADADAQAPHEHAYQRMVREGMGGRTVAGAEVGFMTEEYRQFARLPGARRAVGTIVSVLAAGRPVITHCFAGKDRTGFSVAVVLEAVGIEWDAIMADYLRSNDSVPTLRGVVLQMIERRTDLPPEAAELARARISDEILGVREDYLTAARQQIDETYGSLDGYLRAAGVSEADVTALRKALLT